MSTAEVVSSSLNGVPVLLGESGGAEDPRAIVPSLRQFHFTGSAEGVSPVAPDEYLPALLHRYRDPRRVRSDYPLFVGTSSEDQFSCRPLGDALQHAVDQTSPAQVLKDNLARLEVCARNVLGDDTELHECRSVLAAAGEMLLRELDLPTDHAERLGKDLNALLNQLPQGGELLGSARHAHIQLFVAAARQRLQVRREEFEAELRQLCGQLQSLLDVERSKDPSAHEAESLGEAAGSAAEGLLDPSRLAEVVGGHRGTEIMAADRRRHIEESLAVLQTVHAADSAPFVTVFCRDFAETSCLKATEGVQVREAASPCSDASDGFDTLAAQWTEIFRAVRVARLCLNPDYVPARHDAWMHSFGWEHFSEEELRLLPCVLALDTGTQLSQSQLPELSRLLLSGRRVHVLLSLDPSGDPGVTDRVGSSFRLELAYLGMGHREACVQQSTASRPRHLMTGYLQAMDGTRAALTVVDVMRDTPVGCWLHAGAAVEGRAHPLFHYDPEAGGSWARRLDFTENPSPAEDWSPLSLDYKTDAGEKQTLSLAFTFADYALLEPRFASDFTPLPPGLASDDLLELSSYLDTVDSEEAHRRLPFVWGVNSEGELRRLLVSYRLVRCTRERVGFWRTLQDLAGVRNEYVQNAVARAEASAEAAFEDEKEQLLATHAEELAQLRNTASTEAMHGLAQMLLDTDVGSLAEVTLSSGSVAAPTSAPVVEPAAESGATPETAAPEAPTEEEEEESFTEPWVDSVLCTSCNDCLTINDRVFVYDDNKQVYLADATAGTYKEIVEAAEKCPAECIHPGLPLDKSEPNLEALTQRAEPFN